MEKVLLGAILIIVLVAVARMVIRVVSGSADESKSPACAGCPFDSKCEMQDKPHMSDCVSDGSDGSE